MKRLNIWPTWTWGCPGGGCKLSIQNAAIRAPSPGLTLEDSMDRLLERSLELLAAQSPPTLPLDTLSRALHRERMAVTESVLERSLTKASPVRMIDPWLGANRAIARLRNRRAGRRRWVCLMPTRGEWRQDSSGGPAAAGPGGRLGRSACQIDRAVRTLSEQIDRNSPVELARWIRICQEGTRANARTG